VPCKDEILQ
jgi:hypothetical protein